MNLARRALRLTGRRLPTTKGRLRVAGPTEPVTIRRDRFGVPHIEAGGDDDAWFAIGFCQGQDRAFQLEARVRVVRGTLAALVGRDGLPIDRLSRRIGFARYAAKALEAYEPGERRSMEAFAAGVRAGVHRGRGRRTHALALLRAKPTPFTAADAVGFLAVQAFALASNWDVELARLRMLALDGPDAVSDLHPSYPEHHPVSDRPGEEALAVIDALADDLAAARDLFAGGGGSNNWAIAGSRTASGRPILANDPHLAPALPPHWYLTHVTTPEWSIAGALVPSTPVFGVGHNGHVAWGVTAGLIDNTDLFVEEIGADGTSVRRGDRFVPCERRTETIEVKGGTDETVEVLVTDRGPIVGPAFDGPFGALSMSATWLRPASLGAGFGIGRVQRFDDLRGLFAEWPAVPLNVVAADAEGTIGWQLIGEAPQRGRGGGTIPLDAADPETRWLDTSITTTGLPHTVDPATGFVATANNLPTTDLYLGSDFLDGYRVARITELLRSRRDWDVPSVLAMQRDQVSLPWREMRPLVLQALEGVDDLGETAALLEQWDGVVGPDSVAATLFELLVAELAKAIALARAPRSFAHALGAGFTPLVPYSGLVVRRVAHLVRLVREQPAGWFADGWSDAIQQATRRAMLLVDEHATGTDGRWGSVRPLWLRHPLGARPPLQRVFDLGPIAHGGDANTLDPSPVDPVRPLANPDFAIASLRFVVEVDRWDHARWALPGGQSGNPFSKHYADQLPLWERGDGLTMPWSAEDVRRETRQTLVLQPA